MAADCRSSTLFIKMKFYGEPSSISGREIARQIHVTFWRPSQHSSTQLTSVMKICSTANKEAFIVGSVWTVMVTSMLFGGSSSSTNVTIIAYRRLPHGSSMINEWISIYIIALNEM